MTTQEVMYYVDQHKYKQELQANIELKAIRYKLIVVISAALICFSYSATKNSNAALCLYYEFITKSRFLVSLMRSKEKTDVNRVLIVFPMLRLVLLINK